MLAFSGHRSCFLKRRTKQMELIEKCRLDILLQYSSCIFNCLFCQHLTPAHFLNLFDLHWSSWIMTSDSMNSVWSTAYVCVFLVCEAGEGSTSMLGGDKPHSNIFLLRQRPCTYTTSGPDPKIWVSKTRFLNQCLRCLKNNLLQNLNYEEALLRSVKASVFLNPLWYLSPGSHLRNLGLETDPPWYLNALQSRKAEQVHKWAAVHLHKWAGSSQAEQSFHPTDLLPWKEPHCWG